MLSRTKFLQYNLTKLSSTQLKTIPLAFATIPQQSFSTRSGKYTELLWNIAPVAESAPQTIAQTVESNELFRKNRETKIKARDETITLNELKSSLGKCEYDRKFAIDNFPWIYEMLKKQPDFKADYYDKYFSICHKMINPYQAINIYQDLIASNHPLTKETLYKYLSVLANPRRVLNIRVTNELKSRYYEVHDKKEKLPPVLYINMATALCNSGDFQFALRILRDMINADLLPEPSLCINLLVVAMKNENLPILRVLLSWFAHNFAYRLENGILTHVLQIASKHNDATIALLSFQLLSKFDYPKSVDNYYNLISIHLRNNDVISAIESLQEMDINGLSFKPPKDDIKASYHMQVHNYYETIKEELIRAFLFVPDNGERDLKVRINDIYLALAEQAKSSSSIPLVILDSMMVMYGRVNLIDRAALIFSEIPTVFKQRHDDYSYNALIEAYSTARSSNISHLLSLINNFEVQYRQCTDGSLDRGPDSKTYTILLEYMLRVKDFRVYSDVLKYISKNEIRPAPLTLRRLMYYFAKQHDEANVERTMTLMKTYYHETDVPAYFSFRLKNINDPTTVRNNLPKQFELPEMKEKRQDRVKKFANKDTSTKETTTNETSSTKETNTESQSTPTKSTQKPKKVTPPTTN